jgi:hypothetical protein
MIITVADRDLYLIQIKEELENKKRLLLRKKKEMEKKEKMNQYLGDVRNDYNKYYDYILNEKQQQFNALNLLKDYMGELVKTENLLDNQLRTAKHDQQDILKEISKIKSELDQLM